MKAGVKVIFLARKDSSMIPNIQSVYNYYTFASLSCGIVGCCTGGKTERATGTIETTERQGDRDGDWSVGGGIYCC